MTRQKKESANWNVGQLTFFHWRNRKEKGPRKMNRALDLWDTINCTSIHITGVPYEQKRKRQKEYFKK